MLELLKNKQLSDIGLLDVKRNYVELWRIFSFNGVEFMSFFN